MTNILLSFFALCLLACAGSRESSSEKLDDLGYIGTLPLSLSQERDIPAAEANDITSGSFGGDGSVFVDGDGTPRILFLDRNGDTDSTSGVLQYEGDKFPVNDKAQQFDIRVTITFPRITLQQAAELEARVRKLFPEAQEIDFGLEKEIKAPVESFYHEMPDGPVYFSAPAYNYNVLKRDSTGKVIWPVF